MQTPPPLASPSAELAHPRTPRKLSATKSWYAPSSPVPVVKRDPRQLRISLTHSLLHPATSVSSARAIATKAVSNKSGSVPFAQSQLMSAKSVSELLTSPFAQALFANNFRVRSPLASTFGFNAIDLKAVVYLHVQPTTPRYDKCRRFFITDHKFQPNVLDAPATFTAPTKRLRQTVLQEYFQRIDPTTQDSAAFHPMSSMRYGVAETSGKLRSRPLLLCEFWEMDASLPVLQSLLSSRVPMSPIVTPRAEDSFPEVPYRFVGILKHVMDGESCQRVFEEGVDQFVKGQQMYVDGMDHEMDMDEEDETRVEVPDEVDSCHGLLGAIGMGHADGDDRRMFEVVDGLVFQCFQVPTRLRLGFE